MSIAEPFFFNSPVLRKNGPITIEETVFHRGYKRQGIYHSGFSYLEWRLKKRAGSQDFLDHAQQVVSMAKNKIAVIGCHNCRRKPAAYTEVRSNSSGTIIGSRPDFYLFCEDCLKLALRMELGVVALEFHRIRDFSYAGARDWFIRELYYVFTGKRVRKITADMAFEFFSPQPSLF